jgi:hypothetical protein
MSFGNPYGAKAPSTSTITAAETNAAGQAISRAVDGTGGGTYTPSPGLEFGGDPMTISSDLEVSGELTITGPTTISNTVDFNSDLVMADIVITGIPAFDDGLSIQGPSSQIGSDAYIKRRTSATSASSGSITAEQNDVWWIPTLSGDLTLTLAAPPAAGITVTFSRTERLMGSATDAHTVTFVDVTGSLNLAQFPVSEQAFVEFMSSATHWFPIKWSDNTTVYTLA